MKLEEILGTKEEITYSLLATHDEVDWFYLYGRQREYQSPKKLLAALNATPYPPDLTRYKKVQMVMNVKRVEISKIDFIKL